MYVLGEGGKGGSLRGAEHRIYGATNAGIGAVSSSADFNGDGIEDLVTIGGKGYVFDGPIRSGLTTTDADAVITSDTGFSMPRLPDALVTRDMDGDGTSDLVLGMTDGRSYPDGTGEILVFDGGRLDGAVSGLFADTTLIGDDGRFGVALLAPGDLDGDGNADLVVASDNDGRWTYQGGSVRVFPGPLAPTMDADAASGGWLSATPGLFGTSIAFATGLTGAGVPALVVGAPRDVGEVALAGAVYVIPLGP